MKDWSYYDTSNVQYFGFDYKRDYRNELVRAINETPLTAADRAVAFGKVDSQVKSHMREVNQPFNEALKAREAEFWVDAQAELGYGEFLDKEGIAALHSQAYERGHSGGFQTIFAELEDLSCFAETIAKSALRKAIDKQGS